MAFHKVRSVHDGTQVADVVLYPCQFILMEYAAHPFDGIFAVSSPYDQFADHRVIIDRDFISFVNVTVDTNTDSVRFCNLLDDSREPA